MLPNFNLPCNAVPTPLSMTLPSPPLSPALPPTSLPSPTKKRGKKRSQGEFRRGKRKEDQKKLIYLTKQVYNLIREHRTLSGTKITSQLMLDLKEKRMGVEYKNVQRRVYDALNVLMALGVVTKGKQGTVTLNENSKISISPKEGPNKKGAESTKKRIEKKRRLLQEMIIQQTLLRKLLFMNKTFAGSGYPCTLPFIVLFTRPEAVTEIERGLNLPTIKMNCTKPFIISSDNGILNKLYKLTREDIELIANGKLKDYMYRKLNSAISFGDGYDKMPMREVKLLSEEHKIPKVKYEDMSQREEQRYFTSQFMGSMIPKLEPITSPIDDAFPLEYSPPLSATGGKYAVGAFSEDSDDFNNTTRMFYPGYTS